MSPLPWLFALAACVSLDGRMLAPILPALTATFGAPSGEVGLAMTAYTSAYGVCQLVYGPLSDRYGRVRVLRVTAVLFALGSVLSSLAGSVGEFVGARLLTGLFAAATIPTTFAYIGDTVPYARRQAVIGRFGAVISGGEALAAALAGAVTYFVSWRVLFAAYAVLTLALVLALLRVREARSAPRAAELGYAAILRDRRARRFYAVTLSEGCLVWGGATYFGVLASQRYGFNDLQIGLLLACYGLGRIGGALWLGRLAPALGERALASWGGWIEGGAFALLMLGLPWPVFGACLGAIGLGLAFLHSTLQTRATEIAPAARGKALALFALGYFAGAALGTAAFGWLVDAGASGLVLATCAVGLAALGQVVARRP
ncbi:MAG: hypothetical protein A3F92_03925 [Candidatus Rokubacteria bacterium RIFCSPLOWO2_12_FULL_71_22]|nr:MFS transporter [Candidatus Rokubacteria bacterium]OGL10340.1 MAG: hypothetical protein A3I17_00135 [Candidatus Rokubacteria bacterium RIFCSPLOWO2_02_FULL_72_37]OGL18598.1 MAG: hypothetical protein A3F92_03925 [Candidatus Rokubacteria bacterium RIFCSPLOWO2_12_FULL_71_22]